MSCIYALAGFWFRCCRQTASDASQPKSFASTPDPVGKNPCLSTPTGCLLHDKQQSAVTIGYSTLRRLRKRFLGFARKIPLAEILFVRRVSAAFEVRLCAATCVLAATQLQPSIKVIGPSSMSKNTHALQIFSMRPPSLRTVIGSTGAFVTLLSLLVSNCYTLGLEL
jgi:hypothetical protein